MIFVTVGNATQAFERLLAAVHSVAERPGVSALGPIVTQVGNTPWVEAQQYQVHRFLPPFEFDRLMRQADVIVSHGGCGTLLQAIRLGKVPVAMPRLRRYGEHVNDHQVQLVTALAAEGLVLPAGDSRDLEEAILAASRSSLGSPRRPQARMVDLVAKALHDVTAVR